MSTKHTPGPWSIKRTDVYETIVAPDDELVAFISIKDGCEANAKLIAAAPEMLDAILYALGGLPTDDDMKETEAISDVDKVRKKLITAYKKATS